MQGSQPLRAVPAALQNAPAFCYNCGTDDGAGTGPPFWKLVLKQFDDLLVKVNNALPLALGSGYTLLLPEIVTGILLNSVALQILIVAAVVDFLIALANGESGIRCTVLHCAMQHCSRFVLLLHSLLLFSADLQYMCDATVRFWSQVSSS